MELYTTPAELLRLGGANPGSLRPAEKDRDTGVSCFESEDTLKKAMAAIGKPVRTGTTYVVLDTTLLRGVVVNRDADLAGHWLIRPTDPAGMDAWIRDGSAHQLTAMLQAAIIKPVRKFK